ncbi:uncharacterized protein LOC129589303 [Paramacrobiotus metropolitanus]|uniref:uncharacterized protein LOC129589303 n=1 Tax=Paramacrobiotus metropolitanus TaxID=2943436 RepID=UPI0024465055|nr:uncharacterized protein LOC129589303 [Paramacrobiotus metropolitanus]XP_055339970.1 uncharacterized protein LOC129589303 [Paramacrobiotus metropolitanus]XP_055339971.1 uncharacterized protein LOC129589303 [Paramacrobiotus metropolitanus]XP_055339972.1 uncharacterized protein LOC129589303 [Paramacrobiotus metropolitanus]XP_055339973.1 uncharacterized protein LOC129589303 [Paramacrobiotus metropolitanus]XP_055339974.1 uncharacterized protein LOC129589303 [Paramacrobiotus metropolitanus]XP_05
MADSQAASSDESLKDWTLVDEGPERAPRGSRSSSTSSISVEEITIESLENANKDDATPSQTKEQIAIGKDGTCDSDLDFVRIEDENDDQLNDWITPTVAEHRTECCQHEDANADWSSECTEADSDEETSCESDEQEDSDEPDADTAFPMNEELPADYTLRYGPSCHMYTHRRNNHVNEWLTTALCIVLAVVSGVAIGHFFGSETVVQDHHDEPLPRHAAYQYPPERPASTALSDVQRGQVEILKQLQEMIRTQSDLKQRVVVLEDENRDLRFRLLENRKRCTRILHKPTAVTPVDAPAALNYSGDPPSVQRLQFRHILDLSAPARLSQLLLRQKQNRNAESQTATKSSANLPLTISAVVVPPKRDNNVITARFSTPESLHSPAITIPNSHFIGLPFPRFEPYYYPFLDLETLSRAAAAVDNPESSPDNADLDSNFLLVDSTVIPLKDLVNERKHKSSASRAAPASAIFNPYNFSFESGYRQETAELPNRQQIKLVKVKDLYPEKPVTNEDVKQNRSKTKRANGKATIPDIKKVIKSEKDRIRENRKKFDEEYAEFKARWKNTSNENQSRKEGKLREKAGCKKGKLVDECEEGYCYTKQEKKYSKYEKKDSGKKFWDSLPAVIRKHLDQSAKMERILRGLGSDIVSSKVFQKVVEEIPARLKMSSEWWDCQWKWWQNFARNRRTASYGDCADYLTSWQNRHKQSNSKISKDQDSKFSSLKKAKKSIADRWDEGDKESDNWYTKRVSGRDYQRRSQNPEYGPGARDWTFVRATLREKERSQKKQLKSWRPSNSSWWFFQRARNRDARRQLHYSNVVDGDIYHSAIPGDPIYAFLKDRAVWYGSYHP